MGEERIPAQSDLNKGINGLRLSDVSMDTRTVSIRYHHEGTPSEPLTPPIFHSSTYKLRQVEDFLKVFNEGGSVYSRLGNTTTEIAECQINLLEEGAGSLVFASGMAAATTFLFAFLNAGDHVVYCLPMYSGTQHLLSMMSKFGIETSCVPSGSSVDEYKKAVKPNTKLLFGESPRNPEMSILDLEEFGKLGQSLEGVMTIVDITFASPYLVQPVKYGIDFSLNSCSQWTQLQSGLFSVPTSGPQLVQQRPCSKYMGGHSDLIGGCVTTRTVEQWRTLKNCQTNIGTMLSPHDANLLIRGLKTLPIRMIRHSENALRVAKYLHDHPKVLRVMYPGLPSHPQHEVAKKQMSRGFSGMMAVEVAGGEAGGKIVCESLRIVQLAVSLGGTESLIEHPISMTHGPFLLSEEEIKENKITPGLLRVSIGLEDPDDLIRDFKQALAKIST